MIRSIRSKALRAFATKGETHKLPVQGASVGRLRRQLLTLDAAVSFEDMNLPGWYFHKLQGEERYSIRVTANFRLTFGWDKEDAIDVDLEDYH